MRLLLVTSYPDRETLAQDRRAGQVFLEALAAHGIDVVLHQPWNTLSETGTVDVLLTWPYRMHFSNFRYYALRFEQECSAAGIPIANSIRTGGASQHADDLARWRAAGVSCAPSQRILHDLDELEIPYPIILRRTGIHRGVDMVLAETKEDARRLVARRWRAMETAIREDVGLLPRPFDLAVSFVDTRGADGLYRKWRVYVVGGRVIPCHLMVSREWLVNFEHRMDTEATRAEVRDFLAGDTLVPDVQAAVEVLGAPFVGLDYSFRRDGAPIFWEANRTVSMAGDDGPHGYDHLTVRQCARAWGEALAELCVAVARGKAEHCDVVD